MAGGTGASTGTAGPVRSGVRRPAALLDLTKRGRTFPHLVARLLGLAAVLLALHAVFPGTRWVDLLVWLFSGLVFPISVGGLGWASMLAILAVALHRRKRAGWVIAVLVFSAIWVAELVVVGILVWHMGTGLTEEMPTAFAIAPYAVNIATLGLLLVLLVAHRHDFPARTTRGNRTRAAIALVVGLAISTGVGFALVAAFGGQEHRRNRVLKVLGDALIGRSAETLRAPLWAENLVGVLVAGDSRGRVGAADAVAACGGGAVARRRAGDPRPADRRSARFPVLLRDATRQVGGVLAEPPGGGHLPVAGGRLPGVGRPRSGPRTSGRRRSRAGCGTPTASASRPASSAPPRRVPGRTRPPGFARCGSATRRS